jgi:acetate kinase
LAGGAGDMRDIAAAAGRGDDAAGVALGVWLHRLRREIGAMAAVLGGVDALVFTGGIGEHHADLRSRAGIGLAFLGVDIDVTRNRDAVPDIDVSTASAQCRTLVVRAGEDLEIARQVRVVVSGSG